MNFIPLITYRPTNNWTNKISCNIFLIQNTAALSSSVCLILVQFTCSVNLKHTNLTPKVVHLIFFIQDMSTWRQLAVVPMDRYDFHLKYLFVLFCIGTDVVVILIVVIVIITSTIITENGVFLWQLSNLYTGLLRWGHKLEECWWQIHQGGWKLNQTSTVRILNHLHIHCQAIN